MYKLCVYIPQDHVEQVKRAIFEAGAGRLGNYDRVAWQTRGEGQFRPLERSDPAFGRKGELETVPEYKVETYCQEELIEDVLQALREAHPYEEPGYDVFELRRNLEL